MWWWGEWKCCWKNGRWRRNGGIVIDSDNDNSREFSHALVIQSRLVMSRGESRERSNSSLSHGEP